MLRRRYGYEPDFVDTDEFEAEVPRRRRGGAPVTFLLLLFALAFLAVAVLRVIGFDGNAFTVSALALSPYIAPGGVLLALIAFLLRRRLMALGVMLMASSMVILLVPRYFSNDQPAADGEHIRVMSANVNQGQADAVAIVNLVRANAVDVLTLPELNIPMLSKLDEAGMAELLPYRQVDPRPGAGGSGIASRYPLRTIILIADSTLSQPAAVVDLPGRDDFEILAVHIQAAIHGNADTWRRELSSLPPPNPARIRVLAGDFNATFDHSAFRSVLDPGYVDAAEQTGDGLIPTWSTWPYGPPLTIDHILVAARAAITSYAVLTLPGSDHDAILTEFILP
jgi:endonuclease/exonuclease/phosphatase (EEP) superfamily protein YafD